jgi:two-component system CheB/CheR fusion protein
MSSSKKQARPQQGPSSRLAVIGIGASSGGLDAATKLMDALPAGTGLALILVQHLDAGHPSMMAPLLARHTSLRVVEAAEGMGIEPEHLFIIPPSSYLAVEGGTLRLSKPPARHGARLPFDFLLRSLAASYGPEAGCVILSGTGGDGSTGLLAISEQGGLVIAQEPTEAAYDGMPRAAINTAKVDRVLPVAKIPQALAAFRPTTKSAPEPQFTTAPQISGPAKPSEIGLKPSNSSANLLAPPAETPAPWVELSVDVWLPKIIDLMRTETAQDFSHYKQGTLQRRVERRMALLDIPAAGVDHYLDLLQRDPRELELLTKDLLIHVTEFFRDQEVFKQLEKTVIPALVDDHDPAMPIRIWVAGCSTGEEVYAIAMLCLERLATLAHPAKLQIFASDIDAEAVAAAREGLYPTTIESAVSTARLRRFFNLEDGGYRALPELRSTIVFAVQDVLADLPFSRLDLVACRNLLIYLRPDAQAKVIDLFHFALCPDGLLLLGSAETVANAEGRFDLVSKAQRIYRRIGGGRGRAAPAVRAEPAGEPLPAATRTGRSPSPARPISPTALGELGRQLVLDTYAPASVLINTANEILFSLGPIDHYLRLAPGHATHDLLAASRPGLRPKLAAAIEAARKTNARAEVTGRLTGGGHAGAAGFCLDVVPVLEAGEELLLVCITKAAEAPAPQPALPDQLPQLAELARELETSRNKQQATMRELELSRQEQRIATEEALSVNEEYQSTNEELLTSKEELQSLNEELTALNSQLQETLERQRTLGDDLQNILYSTDVATLFLDLDLRIRFFTPATKSVFAVISTDIGRPLADLAALALNDGLDDDARVVVATLEPLEREIQTKDGVWFRRRILPYRARGDRVEGVVITFTNITGRRQIATALEAAKKQAESANAAKSRFLASASHDLRQPLQTLALLQALLAKVVQGEKAEKLVARLDDTLGAITAMLDTLLDINEIEAGVTNAHLSVFPINGLLDRVREEFTFHAEGKSLGLRIMPCSLDVRSDPRLLEQMLRNLISNALKYTVAGRVLVGCRRRGSVLSVEVWDTGIGIPAGEVDQIFDEYRQVDNPARERSRGLGLGLAIVKRVGELLAHPIIVRSDFGRGSRFAVEVPIAGAQIIAQAIALTGTETSVEMPGEAANETGAQRGSHTGRAAVTAPLVKAGHQSAILVVEDDPDLLAVLEQSLRDEGHMVTTAVDGTTALRQIALSTPELLLADYNLPNGLSGLDLAIGLREAVGRDVPAIMLTGDISAETRDLVTAQNVSLLTKPVRQNDLMIAINELLAADPLPRPPAKQPAPATAARPTVFVVDDDPAVRAAIMAVLANDGLQAEAYPNGETFLEAFRNGAEGCLLVDAYMPGMSGIDLLERLRSAGHHLPALMITGQSDVHMAVTAMKAGALDFIEKPVGRVELLAGITRAMAQSHDTKQLSDWRIEAARRVADLTPRQHEIMTRVLAGQPSKNIAADLGLSQRTVESHRAAVMRKTGAASMPALARLAMAASA